MAKKIDLDFIRENFTPRLISVFGSLNGYHNVEDGRKKDNRTCEVLLIRLLCEGICPHHADTLGICAEPSFDDDYAYSSGTENNIDKTRELNDTAINEN